MCCCGKKKVVPDDDPTLFRWDKYRKMADAWRAYQDEEYNVGLRKTLKKIPCADCLYRCNRCIGKTKLMHGYKGIMNYIALIGMITGLINLAAPVAFQKNPTVHQATDEPNAGVPASNEMFDKLAAAHKNEKLINTQYMFAFENGKSAVRVCTDLSQSEFESITGVDAKHYFGWDIIKNKSSGQYKVFTHEEFVKEGCSNVTTLALNGGCVEDVGGYGDRNFQSAVNTGAKKGHCGSPDVADKMWSPPQGAEGWLWHYMIKIAEPEEFEPSLLTNRTCNTTTCDTSVCQDGDCYDSSQSSCLKWYETSGCEEYNTNWDNSTIGEEPCFQKVGPYETVTNGYCDCGNDRKIWMCGVANSFTCNQVCKCVTPTSSATCDNTTGVANTETCSCSEVKTKGANALPDWMYDKGTIERHKNEKCRFVFGRFNTNLCEGKRVLGYAMHIEWIVNLFLAGTIIRITTQVFFLYWAIFEDNHAYRIMFASKSFMIFLMFFRYGGKNISIAIENEYLQGWPWLLFLIDTVCVAVAMGGVAFGADPFPEMGKGKFTMLLLWITALIEINKLKTVLTNTYYRKSFRQIGNRGVQWPWLRFIFCCKCCKCLKNDMPWCIKQEAEAYPYPEDVYKKEFKKTIFKKLKKKLPDRYEKYMAKLQENDAERYQKIMGWWPEEMSLKSVVTT